jgi:RNA polymerase sigma factor for flagellar operon FliA
MDKIERKILIKQYKPFVEYIVFNLSSKLEMEQSKEKLLKVGVSGLLKATKEYHSNVPIKFETFASIKIKAAVLEYIRNKR